MIPSCPLPIYQFIFSICVNCYFLSHSEFPYIYGPYFQNLDITPVYLTLLTLTPCLFNLSSYLGIWYGDFIYNFFLANVLHFLFQRNFRIIPSSYFEKSIQNFDDKCLDFIGIQGEGKHFYNTESYHACSESVSPVFQILSSFIKIDNFFIGFMHTLHRLIPRYLKILIAIINGSPFLHDNFQLFNSEVFRMQLTYVGFASPFPIFIPFFLVLLRWLDTPPPTVIMNSSVMMHMFDFFLTFMGMLPFVFNLLLHQVAIEHVCTHAYPQGQLRPLPLGCSHHISRVLRPQANLQPCFSI